MLASTLALPSPAHEQDWAFELKWDGMRVLAATVPGGEARLRSRNGRDVTASFPELARLGAEHPRPLLLDGEVVALDGSGRPDFSRLQARMHVTRPTSSLLRSHPVVLLLFDLLRDGDDLTALPWDERRARLDGLGLDAPGWRTTPWFPGTGHTAEDLMAAARQQGLEGVVVKRRASGYQPGSRSADWRKAKLTRTQAVVLVGWRPGRSGSADGPGSLLLGVPDDDGALRYAGRVGSGLGGDERRRLAALLAPLGTDVAPVEAPREVARDAVWVRPDLVGEVTLSEWTSDGRLRHPVWRGLRPDTPPQEVRREP